MGEQSWEVTNLLPIKIVKLDESDDIFDNYSFTGEYDCESEKLIVGLGGYFERVWLPCLSRFS